MNRFIAIVALAVLYPLFFAFGLFNLVGWFVEPLKARIRAVRDFGGLP